MKERETKEYLDLVEQIRGILEKLAGGEDVSITFRPADEENGDLLVVNRTGKGHHITQCYNMELIWERCQDGISVEEVTDKIAESIDLYEEINRTSPVSELGNYEAIREKLVLRPKNYPNNRKKLDQGIFELVGDIALTLYVSVGQYRKVYSSFMVPKGILSVWGKSREEVFETAKQNTYDLFPPRAFQWYDCFDEEGYGREFMTEADKDDFDTSPCGLFLSNEVHVNGAVAVFLPGVAKRLAELIGNDFYIGFTSMHEAVVHDQNSISPKNIRNTLEKLNKDMPCREDFLSERVYFYDRNTDTIRETEELDSDTVTAASCAEPGSEE